MTDEHEQQPIDATQTAASAIVNPREQAFEVLAAATSALAAGTRYPTASEVRLEMKRRTYGGFNPKAMGYKRFRDFLADAEKNGIVKVDNSRPGDLAVSPFHAVNTEADFALTIRRDIWKSFVDWSPDRIRFYDLETDRALAIPTEPVPLEPERYQELRIRLTTSPESFIEIKPVDVHQQIEWTRQWIAKVDEPQVQVLLRSALDAEKPIKAFTAVLRGLPTSYSAGWKRTFQDHVRTRIEDWQRETPSAAGVEIFRDLKAGVSAPPEIAAAEHPAPDLRSAHGHQSIQIKLPHGSLNNSILEAWLRTLREPAAHPHSDGDSLRARLHAAIDRMPIDELKALSIPVGYLFED